MVEIIKKPTGFELGGDIEAAASAILTHDPETREKIAELKTFAPHKIPVLLTGESGVGKELFATVCAGGRPGQNFVRLNCATFQETLIESELFGHEKGSFTGAHSQKKGLFEIANGGTIFLDEIGSLPASAQSRLLRALQSDSGEFQRVGGLNTLKSNFRLVTATNESLSEDSFRGDLFYRINAVHIHIKPLRERSCDIEPLANYFLKREQEKCPKAPDMHFTAESMEALLSHDWPGNVRELRNIVERGYLLAQGNEITLQHLQMNVGVNIQRDPHKHMAEAADIFLRSGKSLLEMQAAFNTVVAGQAVKFHQSPDLAAKKLKIHYGSLKKLLPPEDEGMRPKI